MYENANEMRYIEIITTKTIRPYVLLFHTARESLWHAEHDENGLFFDCLSCITFCAFTLEAYLNHIGSKFVKHWARIERKLNQSEKLDLIADELGVSIERNSSPFNDFKRLLWFRDYVAHGKTTTGELIEKHKVLNGERIPTGKTAWEKECTLKTARRYFDSTRKMVEQLHQATSHGENELPFMFHSSAGYSAQDIIPGRN